LEELMKKQAKSASTEDDEVDDDVKEKRAAAMAAKKAAVEGSLSWYREVRDYFSSKNAKSWKDLPGHNILVNTEPVHLPGFPEEASLSGTPSAAAQFKLSFQKLPYGQISEEQDDAYFALFKMVLRGDVQGIKSHTLKPWGNVKLKAPLRVSVAEKNL